MSHWKFCLTDRDYSWSSGVPVDQDYSFKDAKHIERLRIAKNGTITVTQGYAWDGCSPKFRFLDALYIGTPDGVLSQKTHQPKAYYASLIHDALYQFMGDGNMPYKRKQMDHFFLQLLRESEFWWGNVYYAAVRLVGSVYHQLAKRMKV
jgi:hypothetical protein